MMKKIVYNGVAQHGIIRKLEINYQIGDPVSFYKRICEIKDSIFTTTFIDNKNDTSFTKDNIKNYQVRISKDDDDGDHISLEQMLKADPLYKVLLHFTPYYERLSGKSK